MEIPINGGHSANTSLHNAILFAYFVHIFDQYIPSSIEEKSPCKWITITSVLWHLYDTSFWKCSFIILLPKNRPQKFSVLTRLGYICSTTAIAQIGHIMLPSLHSGDKFLPPQKTGKKNFLSFPFFSVSKGANELISANCYSSKVLRFRYSK